MSTTDQIPDNTKIELHENEVTVEHNLNVLQYALGHLFGSLKLYVASDIEVDGVMYGGIGIQVYIDPQTGKITDVPDRNDLNTNRPDRVFIPAAVDSIRKISTGTFRGAFYIGEPVYNGDVLTEMAKTNLSQSIAAYNEVSGNPLKSS